MTSEEKRGSLADQAAAWVPPWARKKTPAVDHASADPVSGDSDSTRSVPTDPVTTDPVVGDPVSAASGVDDPVSGDPVQADPVPTGSAPIDAVAAGQEAREQAPVAQEPAQAAKEPAPLAEELAPAGRVAHDHADPALPAPATLAGEQAPAGVQQLAAEREEPAAEHEQPVEAASRTEPDATDDSDDADRGPSGPPAVTDAQNGRLALLDEAELRGALEAILLVVDEPVTEQVLAQVLEQPIERIRTVVQRLSQEYTDAGRGFELRRVAGGWRLYTRPEYAPYVERFVLDGQSVRLTQAALETLAVVAYKQPVTRSRISAIRGVNCDGVIRTLLTRGLVQECGVEPETGAHLYQTTPLFLEKLGINSVDELPPLAPFLPDNVEEIADASR